MLKSLRFKTPVVFVVSAVVFAAILLHIPAQEKTVLDIECSAPNVECAQPTVTSKGKGFPLMWLKTSETGVHNGGRIDATGREVRRQAAIVDTSVAVAAAAVVAAVAHITVFRGETVVAQKAVKKSAARKPAARPVKKPAVRRK